MANYILLGVVQGLTEFLPISSSGHLVVIQHVLGIDGNVVFLDLVLHLGTICSLIIFFRKDIFMLLYSFLKAVIDIILRPRISTVFKNDDKFKLCIHIIIITLITGLVGLWAKNFFEEQFTNIQTVIFSFFLMSIILFLTKNFIYGQRNLRHLSLKDSLLFGIIQALAIIPGISRSGATISLLLFRHLDRQSAFKLSFLASIPAVLGAFIWKLSEIQGIPKGSSFIHLLMGFLFSFFSGLVALFILKRILERRNFYKFSYYCFLVFLVTLLLRFINRL